MGGPAFGMTNSILQVVAGGSMGNSLGFLGMFVLEVRLDA
jgi:hypothetical protein